MNPIKQGFKYFYRIKNIKLCTKTCNLCNLVTQKRLRYSLMLILWDLMRLQGRLHPALLIKIEDLL